MPGPDECVFHMGWDTLKQFYKDLGHAGIERVDRLGRRPCFHSLRHTTAALLSRAGVPARIAQVILRHSDIRTTLETYIHLEVLDPTRAVEAVDLAALAEDGETQIRHTQERQRDTS